MEDDPDKSDASISASPSAAGHVTRGAGFRRRAYRILRLGLAAYLGLCLLAFFAYPRLLYHPNADTGALPVSLLGRGGEEFWLDAPGGIRLHGWRIPATKAEGVGGALLAFHGNAGNLSTAAIRLALYSDLGCDVYMVDYHGYGRSGGVPSEANLYQSAQTLWEYVTMEQGRRSEEVAILGYSLGGAVASWLAERHPDARALILESTFTSLPDVAGDFFPFLLCRMIVGDAYNTSHALQP